LLHHRPGDEEESKLVAEDPGGAQTEQLAQQIYADRSKYMHLCIEAGVVSLPNTLARAFKLLDVALD